MWLSIWATNLFRLSKSSFEEPEEESFKDLENAHLLQHLFHTVSPSNSINSIWGRIMASDIESHAQSRYRSSNIFRLGTRTKILQG